MAISSSILSSSNSKNISLSINEYTTKKVTYNDLLQELNNEMHETNVLFSIDYYRTLTECSLNNETDKVLDEVYSLLKNDTDFADDISKWKVGYNSLTKQSKQESKESKPETKSENNNLDAKPSEVKDDTKPKQTSNSNSEQTIDIYSTNKDKWSYLTNVTKPKSPLVLNIGGQEYKFVSVEHAYQSLKHNDFSKPMSEWTIGNVYNSTRYGGWNVAKKIPGTQGTFGVNDKTLPDEEKSSAKLMEFLLQERANIE